jgi:hypothetical protein
MKGYQYLSDSEIIDLLARYADKKKSNFVKMNLLETKVTKEVVEDLIDELERRKQEQNRKSDPASSR